MWQWLAITSGIKKNTEISFTKISACFCGPWCSLCCGYELHGTIKTYPAVCACSKSRAHVASSPPCPSIQLAGVFDLYFPYSSTFDPLLGLGESDWNRNGVAKRLVPCVSKAGASLGPRGFPEKVDFAEPGSHAGGLDVRWPSVTNECIFISNLWEHIIVMKLKGQRLGCWNKKRQRKKDKGNWLVWRGWGANRHVQDTFLCPRKQKLSRKTYGSF